MRFMPSTMRTLRVSFAQPGASSEVSLPSVYTDLHVVSVPRERDEDERGYGLRLARAAEGDRTPLLDAVTGEHLTTELED